MKRVAALVVLGVTAGIACAACSGIVGFPEGTGTATFTWHRISEPPVSPQSFTGSVAGSEVSGRAVVPQLTSFVGEQVIGIWTGTFEGKAFHLTVSATLGYDMNLNAIHVKPGPPCPAGGSCQEQAILIKPDTPVAVTIRGTYGSSRVLGRAQVHIESNGTFDVPFVVTIGAHDVVGTLGGIHERQDTGTATAHFTVAS